MPYYVICPSCKERNSGGAFNCVKCNTSLNGIPREEYPPSGSQKTDQEKSTTALPKENKDLKVESIGHALWRSLQGSLIIFLLASLVTALICWFGNWRTLYNFGNGLIYAGVVLVFVGWYIFRGNQALVGSQLDPHNPMNWAMPGTQAARTRQYWRDYMEGMNSVSVIGFSVVLCFGFGWLLVNLAN